MVRFTRVQSTLVDDQLFFEHADHSLLEAHLLDFAGDLYGQKVSVMFEHFLRSERKFDGLDAIKSQLQLDVAAARLASR